jgi:L-threonylcarbamoyladenylate synthase
MATVPAAPSAISEAARLLRAGELVAFPTETVYGLGAHALDERAVRKVFEAKGRPSYNPLIVHVAALDHARRVTAAWPTAAQRLAERFWPGPLTLVLPKSAVVPSIVTAGLDTVAVRVPAHPVALALIREAGIPIAAPSANRFTELSPTTARHVEKSLADRVAMIVDGGPTAVGIESTVVDLTHGTPIVLRPGAISADDLGSVIGAIAHPAADPTGDAPRPSPGMMQRHYAPRLVDVHAVVTMPATADEYARRLYAAFHDLDDAGCTLILVERVPAESAWAAIADRLARGAR